MIIFSVTGRQVAVLREVKDCRFFWGGAAKDLLSVKKPLENIGLYFFLYVGTSVAPSLDVNCDDAEKVMAFRFVT